MVTIKTMDDAGGGDSPSSNIPQDAQRVEPTIEEPESSQNSAEKTQDASPPPPPTMESANESTKETLLTKETVYLTPLNDERKKTKDENAKRHRKNASSVMPIIPASAEDVGCNDRIRLGICAMDKKARSKPMAEILSRLDEKLFKVIFFGDSVILHTPVEEWPICDVLIAFHSKGYPLDKAEEYVKLRKPFILNDLEMQKTIQDRRKIYDLLEASGIDVPRHVFLSRDGYVSTGTGGGNGANEQEVTEYDDHIEVNGVVIHKPFVEKPVDADDHNIAIYYPTSAGGGCKKLFRKVGNRSSEFYADVNEVRRDGSYIYEQFVETQGTDVKMYTVGPEYGHAEARKSPTVDGKVERDSDGKEVRFPVILTLREKEIARRIVLGFKQMVCGFDLLRVQEGDSVVPYVCDVNGWSFVKNSRKYYDDCALILTQHILAAVRPRDFRTFSTVDPLIMFNRDYYEDDAAKSSGTRTPPLGEYSKQMSHKRVPTMLERATRMIQGDVSGDEEQETGSTHSLHHDAAGPDGAAKPTTLVEGAKLIREIPDHLVSEPASMNSSLVDEKEAEERRISTISAAGGSGAHEEELRCVIAVIRHGDRTPKQKLKIDTSEPHILEYFATHADNPRKDLKVKAKTPLVRFLQTVKMMIAEKEAVKAVMRDKESAEMLNKLRLMRDILEKWKIGGINRKLQIKPKEWEEYVDDEDETHVRATKVQLILKWGGNLTKLGEKQAIQLGQRLRHEMYPDAPGGGILRLHSTFRHDLKIKTSDEGRVMKTAAAFAKGLLELEGEIPPILVSLVHKETGSMHMLDPSGNKEVRKELEECKERINVNLQKDINFEKTTVKEHEELVGPSSMTSLHEALKQAGNPRKTLFKIHKTIGELIVQLEEMLGVMTSADESKGEGLKEDDEREQALSGVKLYKGETLLELTERWRYLYGRLYDEDKDLFDLSRVPDVHDNVRFDMLHNPHLGLTSTLEKLYELAKTMADCVVPQEYGSDVAEKRSIGTKMCGALLEKIKFDLLIARTDNKTDMRYMIDMAYSADLPINSMGRRVRTRLYFTSESHLHTMLNVLRFGGCDGQKSVLSEHGLKVLNEAPEFCYLTQILIRLFEDPRRDMDDPRRYRVEILFSPGATATPMHMAELDRESDSTRFDTAPLEMIGREGLTCQDIEECFSSAIVEGTTETDADGLSLPTSIGESAGAAVSPKKPSSKKKSLPPPVPKAVMVSKPEAVKEKSTDSLGPERTPKQTTKKSDTSSSSATNGPKLKKSSGTLGVKPSLVVRNKSQSEKTNEEKLSEDRRSDMMEQSSSSRAIVDFKKPIREEEEEDEDARIERLARSLARKYFWRAIGVASLVLGTGCLVMAMNVRNNDPYARRRYGTRR